MEIFEHERPRARDYSESRPIVVVMVVAVEIDPVVVVDRNNPPTL